MATTWGTFKKTGIPIPIGFQGCEFGDVYFVDYGNGLDSYRGLTPGTAFKTLSYAHTKCTSNQNDAILVNGVTEIVETAMIPWTKSRVHVFGCNGPAPGLGYGAGARVTLGVTTDASDLATLHNTGIRNTFNGIKFSNDNTLATCLYSLAEGGEYTRYNHCEVYKSGLLTTDLTAEVLCNGDSAQWYGCTLGDMVNERGASGKERPNVLLSRGLISGKVARDCSFVDCEFLHKAAHGDACHVYGPNANDVERRLLFKNCNFWNCILAAAEMTACVTFGATQTDGEVLLVNCAGMNTGALSATTGVYVQGAVPTGATTGIAVQAS